MGRKLEKKTGGKDGWLLKSPDGQTDHVRRSDGKVGSILWIHASAWALIDSPPDIYAFSHFLSLSLSLYLSLSLSLYLSRFLSLSLSLSDRERERERERETFIDNQIDD